MNKFKIYLKSKNKKNYIVTLNIGKSYIDSWEKYSLYSWMKYCKKHKLGLISFNDELISENSKYYKKKQWQKLLIANNLMNSKLNINNLCYLDSDIIINYNSPNIFDFHHPDKISLVSQFNNVPYNLNIITRRIAYLRKKYYSKKYPIDSSIHMNLEQIYHFHNLKNQKDYCCTGLMVFNLKNFESFLTKIFYKYDKNIITLTNGGEEALVNYEILKSKKFKLLDYKFQAIWLFEMAMHYPFLYKLKNKKNSVMIDCIQSSIYNNYFLHFAGSWYDSQMWKNKKILNNSESEIFLRNIEKINKLKLKSKPLGVIKP